MWGGGNCGLKNFVCIYSLFAWQFFLITIPLTTYLPAFPTTQSFCAAIQRTSIYPNRLINPASKTPTDANATAPPHNPVIFDNRGGSKENYHRTSVCLGLFALRWKD